MFDFEKLQVYLMAKAYNLEVKRKILSMPTLDQNTKNQLRRAAMSIMLNIAEGTSRFSRADKRNFYVISRGSTFECVAILELLEAERILPSDLKLKFYQSAEQISKMLFTMIRSLEK